jgi:hypothetical protein
VTADPQSAEPRTLPAPALDALVPAADGWPSASACIAPDDLHADLPEDDRAWLAALVRSAPPDWTAAWRRAEAEQPDRFARLLVAVYAAYYRSPAVAPGLRRLAEAGPRDPDDRFDPALLPPSSRRTP